MSHVGDHHGSTLDHQEGAGWTGVTPEKKDWAAGRLYMDTYGRRVDRLTAVLFNTEQVKQKWGSGYWSKTCPGFTGDTRGAA